MKITKICAILLCIVMILPAAVSAASPITGESNRETYTLADGITRTYVETPSDSVYKTQKINIVEVDLSKRNVYFDVFYGRNNAARLQRTKDAMAAFAQADNGKTPVVGVNGDMWMVAYAQARIEGSGTEYLGYSDAVVKKEFPVTRSFNISDGEIYTTESIPQETPYSGLTYSFGVTDDFVPVMGMPVATLEVTGNEEFFYADGINRLPANNALIIYTDKVQNQLYGFALDDAYEILLNVGYDYKMAHGASVTGTVAAIYGPDDAENPGVIDETQIILTARGNRVADLEKFAIGDSINISVTVSDACGDTERWQRVTNCVGGNFALAVNGKPTNPAALSGATYPATIIASDKNGKLVLITMDGRQSGYSLGLNQVNSDKLMTDLGLYNALLLDGGGSTTMVVADAGQYKTVNKPSDSSGDRTVNNSVIISTGPQRAEQGELNLNTGSGIDMDPRNITFEDMAAFIGLVEVTNECIASIDNGELKLTAHDLKVNDPFTYIWYDRLKTSITAEEYPCCTIIYRIPATNFSSSYKSEIFFNTNGQGARAGQSVLHNVRRTGEKYAYLTFNAASLSEWKGTISSIRLDFFAQAYEGDVMYVHNILFSKNTTEAAAEAKNIVAALNAATSFTVKFDVGRYGVAPADQVVKAGTSPVRPEDPTADGMAFVGWYTDSTYENAFDFSTVITDSLTLHAKWSKVFTVSFDTGSDAVIDPISVVANNTVPLPQNPERDGFTFAGWFTDTALSKPFEPGTPIKNNVTLHAKWDKNHTVHVPAEAVRENEVAPSCTAEGSYDEVVYCSECGEEISRETKTVDKIAHTPAEAVRENEVAPSCTAEGSYDEVVYCSECEGEISRETKTVDKIPHTMIHTDAVEATPESDGNTEYWKCSVCEKYFADENGDNEISAEDTVVKYVPDVTPDLLPGDVNGDGKVNVRDIAMMMRAQAGWSQPDYVEKNQDYNGDGKFNARDIATLMRDVASGKVS